MVDWEKKFPNEATLYTSYFNYYYLKSRSNNEIIDDNEDKVALLPSIDFKSLDVGFDKKEFNKGLVKLDIGISRNPDLLALRLFKIHFLEEIEDWDAFTEEICSTIKHSSKINNKWDWKGISRDDNNKEDFLSTIYELESKLFDIENQEKLLKIEEISEEIDHYFPDEIDNLKRLYVIYFNTKKFQKGIDVLFRLQKKLPNEFNPVFQIGRGYMLLGNKSKAIEYFTKSIDYGNNDEKDFAKRLIKTVNTR